MNKGCGKFEETILDLVYDELDDAAAEALRTHATDCSACAAAVAELHSIRRLSAKPAALTPPPTLDAALLAAARESLSTPVHSPAPVAPEQTGFGDMLRAWLLHPAFAGAAVVALVLSMTLFMTLRGEKSSESTPTVESVLEEREAQTAAEPAAVSDEGMTTAKSESPMPRIDKSADTPDEVAADEDDRPAALEPIVLEDDNAAENKRIVREDAKKTSSARRSRSASSSKGSAASPSFGYAPDGNAGASSGAGSGRASMKLDDLLGAPAASAPAVEAPQKAKPQAPKRKASAAPSAAPSAPTFAPPPPAKAKPSASKEGFGGFNADAEVDFAEDQAQADYSAPALDEAPAEEAAPERSRAPKTKAPAASGPTPTNDAYAEGMDAYRRGNCAVARDRLSEVVGYPSRYPGKSASALHHIGRCEKRSGRCAAALTFYERLLTSYPGYSGRPEALYEAAQCYQRLGRTDKARSALKALEQIPGWESRARRAESEL